MREVDDFVRFVDELDVTAPVSPELLKLAAEVVARQEDRADEDIEDWARRLAEDFASYDD